MGGKFVKLFACCFQHRDQKEDEGIELTATRAATTATSPPPLFSPTTITTITADRNNSDTVTTASHPTNQDATDTITPTSNTQSHSIDSNSKPASDPDQITQLPTTAVAENGEVYSTQMPSTHAESEADIRRKMYERLRVSEMERSQRDAYNQWANVKNAAVERKKMLEKLRRPAPISGA